MSNLKQKFIKFGENLKININTDNKKKTITAVVAILLVLTLIIGISYALEIFQGISGDNVIKSGKVAMSYTESSNVINITNALPMTDEAGKQQTNYFDFSISSKADTNADDNDGITIPYDLIIEPKTIDSDKDALTNEQIKVYLTKIENGTETIALEPIKISELTKKDTNFNLYSTENVHKNGSGAITTKYRLRAWIDYGVDASTWKDAKQKQYKFAINVNATGEFGSNVNLDKSGVNEPVLASNMIPVYYDETDDNWKKADSTNSNKNYKWYDYNKKMWANAVTIYDNSYNTKVLEENKTVSIPNEQIQVDTYEINIDSNYYEHTSTMAFTFKTGSTGGNYSFEYLLNEPSKADMIDNYFSGNYIITLNDTELIVNPKSSNSYRMYLGTLNANTSYELKLTVETDPYSDSPTATLAISNIKLPENLAEDLTYISYDGTKTTRTTYPQKTYDSYSFNNETGNYELNLKDNKEAVKFSDDTIGKYVCSDLKSTTCKELYEITEINGNNATKVKVHGAEGTTTRSEYLNAPVGTPIQMDAINTMFVWIPRYKYTYFSSATPVEIPIEFERGTESTGTISCTDAIAANSGKSENCTDTTNGSLVVGKSTYTHPAFTFGDEELTGIWVGKFENSGDSTVTIIPDTISNKNTILSTRFVSTRNMELANNIYGFPQNGTTLNTYTGEITGDSNNLDTHMMKNMDWGAVTYLSHSKYGKNGEVFINNSGAYNEEDAFYTGRSGGNVGGSTPTNLIYPTQTSTVQYNNYGFYTYDGYLLKYNTNSKSATRDLSKVASTTGNIYGIYDMAGGAIEYVMGNMQDESNNFCPKQSGMWSSSTDKLLNKYYDKYSYGGSMTEYTLGKLGDATIEMQPTEYYNGTWYKDNSSFLRYDYPWFFRGGFFISREGDGIFDFGGQNGHSINRESSRTVLSITTP